MTTVMTGTVMNWSAAKAEKLFKLPAPEVKIPAAKPMAGWMIAAFAAGCAIAGVMTQSLGLSASFLPSILLVILGISEILNSKGQEK
jgi:hypothetical protein